MEERYYKAMNKKIESNTVKMVEDISMGFYLWMQKNDYNHNKKEMVEKRFAEYMKEYFANKINYN